MNQRGDERRDPEEARAEAARLLDLLQSGEIEDLDDLDEEQLALLREHLGEEELETLLDRLQVPWIPGA